MNPVLCAYSSEEPSIEGAIPRPQNEEQAASLNAFLRSVAAILDFGREADRVAKIAKNECLIRVGGEPDHNIEPTD